MPYPAFETTRFLPHNIKGHPFWAGGLSHVSSKIGSGCDFFRLLNEATRLPAGGDEGSAGYLSRHIAHERGAAQAKRLFVRLVSALGPLMLEKIEGFVNACENSRGTVFKGDGNGLFPLNVIQQH